MSEQFMKDYYGQLVGAKIVDFYLSEDGFPSYILQHPKMGKVLVEVSCDPEGNHEGFLFISDTNGE